MVAHGLAYIDIQDGYYVLDWLVSMIRTNVWVVKGGGVATRRRRRRGVDVVLYEVWFIGDEYVCIMCVSCARMGVMDAGWRLWWVFG